MYINTIGLVI